MEERFSFFIGCPACLAQVPAACAIAGQPLVCGACGQEFRVPDAPALPVDGPGPAAPRPRGTATAAGRRRLVAETVLAALLAAALSAYLALRPGPERRALAQFASDTVSDRPLAAIAEVRGRSWMGTTPSQPEGVAPMRGMDDATLLAPVIIGGDQLRRVAGILRPHAFSENAQGMQHRRRTVGALAAEAYAEVARQVHDAEAAGCLVDLFLGMPSQDRPDLARRMVVEGDFPEALVLTPFHGGDGALLVSGGPPPLATKRSPYRGWLLACRGAGWPAEHRVIRLESGNP